MEPSTGFDALAPSFQDKFWGSLDPDVRLFFERFERKEDWTYRYGEIPDMFKHISEALPMIGNQKSEVISTKIMHELIMLLSSLPFKECIYAIGWLDRNVKSEYDIGDGVRIYLEAERIFEDEPNSPLYLHAKIIKERVRVILKTSLSSELFCNINTMGEFI